jgi:hypothetical protein
VLAGRQVLSPAEGLEGEIAIPAEIEAAEEVAQEVQMEALAAATAKIKMDEEETEKGEKRIGY